MKLIKAFLIITIFLTISLPSKENNLLVKKNSHNFFIETKKMVLEQNYPNPFNPSTTISYSIPFVETGYIPSLQIKIYDVLGRKVATLVNEEKSAGNYEVTFNADNLPAGRQGLPSGVYFYRLETKNFVETKKMVLLR